MSRVFAFNFQCLHATAHVRGCLCMCVCVCVMFLGVFLAECKTFKIFPASLRCQILWCQICYLWKSVFILCARINNAVLPALFFLLVTLRWLFLCFPKQFKWVLIRASSAFTVLDFRLHSICRFQINLQLFFFIILEDGMLEFIVVVVCNNCWVPCSELKKSYF